MHLSCTYGFDILLAHLWSIYVLSWIPDHIQSSMLTLSWRPYSSLEETKRVYHLERAVQRVCRRYGSIPDTTVFDVWKGFDCSEIAWGGRCVESRSWLLGTWIHHWECIRHHASSFKGYKFVTIRMRRNSLLVWSWLRRRPASRYWSRVSRRHYSHSWVRTIPFSWY